MKGGGDFAFVVKYERKGMVIHHLRAIG